MAFSISRFRLNVASGFVLAATTLGAQFVVIPIYLGELGAETYGIWALLSVVTLVGRLGDLGVSESLSRFVALSSERALESKTSKYAASGIFLALISGTVLFVIIAIFRNSILQFLNIPINRSEFIADVLVGLGAALVLALTASAVRGVLAGFQRSDVANYLSVVGLVMQVGLSLLLLHLGYGLWALLIGMIANHSWCAGSGMLRILRIGRLPAKSLIRIDFQCTSDLIGMGSKLLVGRVVALGMDPLAMLTISHAFGVTYAGYFDITRRVVFYIRSLIAGALRAIVPRVSQLDTSGDVGLHQIARLNRRLLASVLGLGVPLGAGLLLMSSFLFDVWLRDANDPVIVQSFRIVFVAYAVNILAIPAYMTLLGWGLAIWALRVSIFTASLILVGVVINALMSYELGVLGIVSAYSAGLVGGGMMAIFAYRRELAVRLADIGKYSE